MSDCSTFDCSSYHMNLDNLPLSINCFGKPNFIREKKKKQHF